MKRHLIILGALLAFILFSAKSCDDDPGANRDAEEEALIGAMDSVINEFGTEYLDEESLFAFTQKAKQKLMDYSDYMNMANDTSLDSAFRNQALAMTIELFKKGSGPIESFAGRVIKIDSIRLIEPLHLTGTVLYKGVLGFREGIKSLGGDTTADVSSWKKVEFLATKSNKLFATDTLRIWQVYLGEIF